MHIFIKAFKEFYDFLYLGYLMFFQRVESTLLPPIKFNKNCNNSGNFIASEIRPGIINI